VFNYNGLATQKGWTTLVIPKTVMGGCFGEIGALGERRGRFQDAVMMDVVELFQIRNWKAESKQGGEWRKEIGEAMARKWIKALYKKKKKNIFFPLT
jgi:hypothetical protein